MQVEFIELTLDEGKELKSVKINESYYGITLVEGKLHITSEGFATPLQAANQTRKLKKQKNVKSPVTKTEIPKAKTPKVVEKQQPKLYTETEMASLTHLRFREAWVIMNRKGMYVERALTKTQVVRYCKSRDKAKSFKTYEEAIMLTKTLDSVQEVGHTLKRFFVENS